VSQWDRPRDGDGKSKTNRDSKANMGEAAIDIKWRLEQWFPELEPAMHKRLKQLHDELLKFNKTVNLISVKTMPHADAIHFADSVLAAKLIAGSAALKEVYDFGSGNGFPGLVMAILFQATKFHLVEIDQRKAEYLKHCITALGLKNCDVLIRPVEALDAGSVDVAVCRGFASITKALLGTRKIFRKGGRLFHLKSEEWASEVAAIPTQLCSYWTPSLVGEYKLPVGEIRFAIVKTEKTSD